MSEIIAIREAARRLGVSDTAVRKAIAAGRVTIAEKDERGNPKLAWPQVRDQWQANSDSSKRSHVGPNGTSPRSKEYAARPPEVRLPTSGSGGGGDAAQGRAQAAKDDEPAKPGGPSYAQSRAVREAYAARLAKLDFEERSGKLLNAEQVRIEAFKAHRKIRDAMLSIPDRCAPLLAAMASEAEVHAYLLGEINGILRQLAADIYAPPAAA